MLKQGFYLKNKNHKILYFIKREIINKYISKTQKIKKGDCYDNFSLLIIYIIYKAH